LRAEYFRGVAERLRQEGTEVHLLRVAPSGSIAQRAEQLAQLVRSLDTEKVSIIAHSMGGLDARWAISRLGLASRVASLTTVGTPHLGTPVADIGTRLLGEKLGLRRVFTWARLDIQAFYDLTTGHLAAFNREAPDAPGVVYASYVASVEEEGVQR